MDLRSGYPLWLVRSGLPFTYPKLEKNISTNTVVLGGGISGALCAHYLLKNNIDCVVLDARTIGLGSTCASTALLQYQIDTSLHELSAKVGKENAARAFSLCARSVDTLGELCKEIGSEDFERRRTLYYASYSKHISFLEKEYAAHKEAGFDVEFWDRRDIKRKFGFEAPAALYSNHSAQTDSYNLTHKLLQHNLPKGLQVYDRTNAEHIQHKENGIVIKTSNGFTLKAKKLVYATGYESVNYVSKKIVDLHSTYAVASEQTTDRNFWFDDCLIWETKQPYLYLTTVHGNRIMIGGRDEKFSNQVKRDLLIKKKSKQLTNDFGKLFPQVEFIPEFSWTGTFGVTKDGLPYIGKYPPLANALFALGFGGNGITFSVIAAEIIADLIKGRTNQDSNLFSFNR